jgi:microcystin-dependent protein
MTDYARIHDFTAKDALTTGDPLKVIKGSEVDAEFDALATHVATKVDEPASPSQDDVLVYDSGAWTASAGNFVPVGCVMPYAGTTEPTDWLFCDGASLSTTTYAALFAVIGYTYGGSGASFSLPDLQGRVVAGRDDMSETSQNRLTTPINGDTLGAAGGSETAAAELKTHTHSVTGTAATGGTHTHTNTMSTGGGGNATYWEAVNNKHQFNTFSRDLGGDGSHSHTVSGTAAAPAGTGSSHTNVQPTIILNYIIRT